MIKKLSLHNKATDAVYYSTVASSLPFYCSIFYGSSSCQCGHHNDSQNPQHSTQEHTAAIGATSISAIH
jgi:hypothetical protein